MAECLLISTLKRVYPIVSEFLEVLSISQSIALDCSILCGSDIAAQFMFSPLVHDDYRVKLSSTLLYLLYLLVEYFKDKN